MWPNASRGSAATLLLWAFYLGAQVGSEAREHGLVAAATEAACEAARSGVLEIARASGTTVELGNCRELSPDDLKPQRSGGALSQAPSLSDQARDAAPGAVRRPSILKCLSRDVCEERF